MIKVIPGEYNKQQSVVNGVDIIPLPCGKCIGCRLDYSRQWADRCMLEAQYHEHNVFLTLTYNDKWLPEPRVGSMIHSLSKEHLQKFMKRLRKRFPEQRIRFFACGEYGSPEKSFRPHYHLILFGLDLPDLVMIRKDPKNGFFYYESDIIKDIWSDPETHDSYGFHLIANVTWETCAYTARYIVKKQKGINSSVYEDLNYEPEFTLMSRKPGIGKQFYDDHPDIVMRDYYISTDKGSRKIQSNRYYDKLFDFDYHDDLLWIKEDRVKSTLQRDMLKEELSSLSYIERLRSEEINKEAQIKVLKRKEL